MMECWVTLGDGNRVDLPQAVRWEFSYGTGLPCDSFFVRCLWESGQERTLSAACRFYAAWEGVRVFTGVVDEFSCVCGREGLYLEVSGRGMAALLLDNEAMPADYETATAEDILRDHVTPYGITAAEIAPVSATSVYTVASGTSQWKALENFCRTYGGFAPRFRRDGLLVAAPERDDGRRIVIGADSPVLSCILREDHYGVLTEVLVIDKTRNVSYSVKNQDMIDRGGQCRRVVYTPGQSTWAAMRYTGEYQIRRSREEEVTIELELAGCFPAFPGDVVRLRLETLGIDGEYRVAEAENTASPERGEVSRLTLRERM